MHEIYNSPHHRISKRDICWLCNTTRARSDVGLCSECRERLIEESRGER